MKVINFIDIRNTISLMLCVLVVILGLFLNVDVVLADTTAVPSGFTATQLIDYNMTAPTGVKVAPDGRIFVFDLFGTIKIFNEGSGFNATPFGSVSVDATGDRGLLGAVFDTDFANNPYVYIHYVGTDDKVRIGRFNASSSVGTNFTVLYTSPTASGGQHAGGGIVMDKNGYILFGIGDSGTPTNSQDLTTVHGKIHRIFRDGTVPVNPFYGQAGVPNTIYAYGVRNPFRMTLDKLTGAVYEGDVGYNTWEEVNLMQPGKNYGWALQEGPCTSACSFQDPVYWYPHQFATNNTNDAAIVLGPVYRGNLYPAEYQGKLFLSDYVQGFLRTINPATTSSSSVTFNTGNGAVIDMDIAPNGKLYFVTISSPRLYRVDYATSTINQPPTAVATAATSTGLAPLSVNFSSASSSDPEGLSLTYLWNFGDGSTSTLPNPTKIYTTDGQYSVRLSVSDGVTVIQSSAITISVGSAPTLIITSPELSPNYVGGQTVSYAVSGIDTDGQPLASTSITTTIRLQHSDHSHPFAGPFIGTAGQIITPLDGELSPDVWLRFTFEAVGKNGVHTIITRDIHPQIAQITVTTSPAGLNVILDGSNHIIPPTVQGVIGMNRQIAAPSPQIFNGKKYEFDSWSDGGARDHNFAFPATNTVYTANYKEASTSSSTPVNLLANGSFENSGSLPSNWFFSRWGNNDISGTITPDAHTGSWGANLTATSIINGDGRIYNLPVPVNSQTVYGIQYFYKSTVPFKAVADVTLMDNTHSYIWLGISQPHSAWTEQNWTVSTPTSTKNIIINLYQTVPGTIQLDDISLFDPQIAPPVVTNQSPEVNLTVANNTIMYGASTTLSWSATGTTTTCVASSGWSGTKPLAGSQVIAPTTTQTYTLACANQSGTTTKSVTVNVNTPSTLSLITNPSVENLTTGGKPAGFTPQSWGTNDAVMTHKTGDAYDGVRSLDAVITTLSSGEAGWISDPIAISPQTTYILSEFAKATGPTKVQIEVTLADGSKQYLWLGKLTESTTWTEFSKSFVTPNNAVTIQILTYLTGVGSYNIDQITLTPASTLVPPTLNLTADATTINPNGTTTLHWSTTGNNLLCLASGGWSGSQTVNGSISVSPTTTTTYTLNCTNDNGSVQKSVTVSVQTIILPPPTGTNLISPSTDFGSSDPAGWIKGNWGNNTTSYSVATSGRTDNSALHITMTNYVDGDAKWFFAPVTINGSSTYTYSHWYKSDVDTSFVLEYTLAGGQKTYSWLGSVSASPDWTQKTLTLTPPSDTVKVTIHQVLKQNGNLDTDDYSLTLN